MKRQKEGLPLFLGRRVVIHRGDDLALRGTLTHAYSDMVFLSEVETVDPVEQVEGDVGIAREHIHFIQVLS